MTTKAERSVSAWPRILNFGIVGGVLLILLGLIQYFTLFMATSAEGTLVGVGIAVVIFFISVALSIRSHRDKDLGGYISFVKCVSVGVATVIVSGLIFGIFNYVLNNYIDPEAYPKMVEASKEWYFKGWLNLDDEQINDLVDQDNVNELPLIQMIPFVLTSSIAFGLAISTIVGAFLKKERPKNG